MLKYLVPSIPLAHVPALIFFTVLGSLIAGSYGVLHDHVTYSIGPQYFTHFKFDQFHWANLRMGNRVYVSCIGFLATWWVGMIVAWILGRRMLPNQSRSVAAKKILAGFGVVFVTGFAAGLLAYGYGLYLGPGGDYSKWQPAMEKLGVTNTWAFVRVAYIHNAGYLGGAIGLVLTYFVIRPEKV
ncbi:MAG: hypothetical protein AB8B55_00645 [Mariniblastus sp.]